MIQLNRTLRRVFLSVLFLFLHFFALPVQSLALSSSSYIPFVAVDSSAGNDANCQMINITTTTPIGSAIYPCASITQAVQLLGNMSPGSFGWIYMQPGNYQVPDLMLPSADIVFSLHLPPVPSGSSYVFPASMSENVDIRVTWDCAGSQYCVRSFNSGLRIEGVSFRNVIFHAVYHAGTVQPSDVTLMQVDCQNSGGLLYKVNGNAWMSEVQLINGTNYPNATGYNPFATGLVHFINTNVTLTNSEFRGNALTGETPFMPSTLAVISMTGLTTFSMTNTTFDGNAVRKSTSRPPGETVCAAGPGLSFNVTDISISVQTSTFRNQFVKGGNVCGAAMSVFTTSDAGHTVDIQVASTLFSNNSIYNPKGAAFGAAAGLMIGTDHGYFHQLLYADSSPTFTIRDSTFIDNLASVAPSLSIQRVKQVQIINCYFARNRGLIGSALRLSDGLYSSIIPTPLLIQGCLFESNDAPNIQFTTRWTMNVKQSNFTGAVRSDSSGAIIFEKIPRIDEVGFLNVDSCVFSNNMGMQGGAIGATAGTMTISNSAFLNNTALLGGAVYSSRANLYLKSSIFSNNSVSLLRTSGSMEGGAVYGVASHFEIDRCNFSYSVVNLDNGLPQCDGVTSGTTVSSTWRGGAISVRESFLVITTSVFDHSSACAGGDVYADGNSVYVIDCSLSNSQAYVGGSLAIKGVDSLYISGTSFANISALSYAGALLLLTADDFSITGNDFNNITAGGDGGVIYFAQMSSSSSSAAYYNTFTNCSAPQGGGAIAFFSTAAGLPFQPLGFTDDDGNIITPPDGKYVQWGEEQATNPFTIVSSYNEINIYPGQTFTDSYYTDPILLRVSAIDGFNQTVIGSRGMVIQVTAVQTDGLPPRGITIGGVVLQQITDDLAAADFSSLTIAGQPGDYQLVFSVIASPSIPNIIVPLTISDQCPGELFYSDASGSCAACPNNLLVYEPTANECLPCEEGRVVTFDGTTCAACDLGSTNYGSPSCIPCGANTYQPTPLSRCESCLLDGMEGLSCSSVDGLAAVLPGYFAYSVLLENATVPTLQTVECPPNYCNGGFVQANWSDPIMDYKNNSASTVVPLFSSAVTRYDQCAHPRLAAEDNYLCGECVPGLIVWGDKCSQCDSVDPGRMFLFLFISFALVMFLVRASLSSASAGHSTIVLYFVQTALLEVGSSSNLLGWLQIGLLSPSSFSDCVAPLSVYQQSTFQMLMPLFLLGELLIVMVFHYVWFRFRQQDVALPNQPRGALSYQSAFALRSRFLAVIDAFSIDIYISASLSILLFTYTQVMMESFRLLACVDVGGVRVVFTQPTMRCDSDEYKSITVLIGFVTAYVGLLPLCVFIFLWRNNTLVQLSHDLMNREEEMESDDKSQPPRPAVQSANSQQPSDEEVSRFLLRYSAIFSMYSSSTWFWKSILLSRRIVFVAISVSLTRKPNMKFFAYGFSHLCSLLLQGYFRPFELTFFNYMEIASHVILILLSQSLTAILPPYTTRTEMYLFLLVVLPLPVYGIIVLFERYSHRRTRRELEARLFERGTVDHRDSIAQPHLPASPSASGIELIDIGLNPVRAPIPEPAAASSDARVLPESMVRSEEDVQSDSHWL